MQVLAGTCYVDVPESNQKLVVPTLAARSSMQSTNGWVNTVMLKLVGNKYTPMIKNHLRCLHLTRLIHLLAEEWAWAHYVIKMAQQKFVFVSISLMTHTNQHSYTLLQSKLTVRYHHARSTSVNHITKFIHLKLHSFPSNLAQSVQFLLHQHTGKNLKRAVVCINCDFC